MVKVIQPNVPPEWEELWAKIVAWFGRYGVPIWVGKWFQMTRGGYARKRRQSQLSDVKIAWKALSTATKYLWKLAAYRAYGYYRSWRYFVADYLYRKKHGYSLPGYATNFHQLFCLKIANPGAAKDVYCLYDDKDRVGKIRVRFSYAKQEVTLSPTWSFQMQARLYYFTAGAVKYDEHTWTSPAGTQGWAYVDERFGVTNRKYYHLRIILTIKNYDAIVWLDNLRIADKAGEFLTERWNVKDYAAWEPNLLYRKIGWGFHPSYESPYFIHTYSFPMPSDYWGDLQKAADDAKKISEEIDEDVAVVAAVLEAHKTDDPIDHPDGSVTSPKFKPTVLSDTLAADFLTVTTGSWVDTGLSISITPAYDCNIVFISKGGVQHSVANTVPALAIRHDSIEDIWSLDRHNAILANKDYCHQLIGMIPLTEDTAYTFKMYIYNYIAGTARLKGDVNRTKLEAFVVAR